MIEEIFQLKFASNVNCIARNTELFNQYGYDFIKNWVLFKIIENQYCTTQFDNIIFFKEKQNGHTVCHFRWGSLQEFHKYYLDIKNMKRHIEDEKSSWELAKIRDNFILNHRPLYGDLFFKPNVKLSQKKLDAVAREIINICLK